MKPSHHAQGLAYVEVLLATVMVAVLLAPTLDALSSGLLSQAGSTALSGQDAALRNKFEEVQSKPYSVLLAETKLAGGNTKTGISQTLSDPEGPNRRIVTIYRSDGSDGGDASSTDTGLLYIKVAWEADSTAPALVTLRSKWL